LSIDESKAIEIVPETRYCYLTFLRLVFHQYPKRAILGATLMITQSFLYNAIFFTYALVLIHFYNVPSNKIPIYGLAFSSGNLIGPLALGPLFEEVFLGVNAAGKSLETVTKPLTSVDERALAGPATPAAAA
jgi:hypothetical protein